jgi:arsenate reductase
MTEPTTSGARERALHLLFVCTHNRCRSILAEALARELAGGRIRASSAGSQPSGTVHPDTLAHLQQRGIDTTGLSSSSWDDCAGPAPDAVITVCDAAAGEECPLWLGSATKAHWGLPDPSRVAGTAAQRAEAFEKVIATIDRRLRRLLALDFSAMNSEELHEVLQGIADEDL